MCSPRRPRLPTGDETNWFSLASAIRVYRHFLELDTDHDGMLTPDELASYGDGLLSLTPAFVSSGLCAPDRALDLAPFECGTAPDGP
jgi:hypothetical protein